MGDHSLEIQVLSDFQTLQDQGPDFKSELRFQIKRLEIHGSNKGGAIQCETCPDNMIPNDDKTKCEACPPG